MVSNEAIRVSREFKKMVKYYKAKIHLTGGKEKTTAQITKIIANNIDKEKLWNDGFR